MANVLEPQSAVGAEILPLQEGDRFTRREFHDRYRTYSGRIRYELLQGVVHMTAAERFQHGRYEQLIGALLDLYEEQTPGISAARNSTVILDDQNEPQPDLLLRVQTEYGGNSSVDAAGYLTGPPELIIEIAYSSLKRDLTVKRDIYRELGVQEYLVICVEPAEFCWFAWPAGERKLDADGVFRSFAFPGLWIDSHALFQEQTKTLRHTARLGLNEPAHAEFVRQMELRRQS